MVITSQIKNATTIEMLLSTYNAHQHELNQIHLSACWSTLGQLSKRQAEQRLLQ